MKILVAHNFYKQAGGEDQCVAAEVAMLQARGHDVIQYCLYNDAIDAMSRLRAAGRAIWNRSAYREVRELIRRHRPRIVHFHNTFPLISPAAYYAAKMEGVGVVQTLHNYRLLCPNALFFRDGRVCETCLGRSIPWPGVIHKCYRGSHATSAAVATMVATHRALGTWRQAVDVYIALTEFSRRKFVAGGLPADKIAVKPNFVHPDPGPAEGGTGDYAVFVGRLSAEKGIKVLLDAWKNLRGAVPLKIVGDGPMAAAVQEAAANDSRIQWLGRRPPDEVHALIGAAMFLVSPSSCYETFGRVLIEAFAKGAPVIAPRLGAMAEIVDHGRTGLHFEPADAGDLAAKVRQLIAQPLERSRMRAAARQEYQRKFTAEANYGALMAIYERAHANGRFRQSRSVRPESGDNRKIAMNLSGPPKVNLFGVNVNVTTYTEATNMIIQAAARGMPALVACQSVHAVVTASRDPLLRDKINAFDLVTPDGQPVRWAMNFLHRAQLSERVYGPELMLRVCRRAAELGIPIYLYGGTPEVLAKLERNLAEACPGLRFAGSKAPPFRPLTPQEDEVVVKHINASGAGLVFIGLGCPKQEHFAYEHRTRIQAVQICVGAAFDFHAGVKKMAPAWMQRRGLEWLHRLCHEPRRLWRRYLVTNTVFLAKLAVNLMRRFCHESGLGGDHRAGILSIPCHANVRVCQEPYQETNTFPEPSGF